MAKFNPGNVSKEEAQVTEDGLKLNLIMPAKTFSSGKEGFFRQGMLVTEDGKKYRLNLQVYEAK